MGNLSQLRGKLGVGAKMAQGSGLDCTLGTILAGSFDLGHVFFVVTKNTRRRAHSGWPVSCVPSRLALISEGMASKGRQNKPGQLGRARIADKTVSVLAAPACFDCFGLSYLS